MGHNNLCRSHPSDTLHHLVLGLGVEGARCLVHNQNGGFLGQCRRHLYALSLTAAEVLSTLYNLRAEALGTTHYVGTYLCVVAGYHHREIFYRWIPHADVLRHRIVEEYHVLVDDGHRVCQFLVRDGLDGSAVKQYLSTPRLIES